MSVLCSIDYIRKTTTDVNLTHRIDTLFWSMAFRRRLPTSPAVSSSSPKISFGTITRASLSYALLNVICMECMEPRRLE